MKISFLKLRWVFLILYLIILASLALIYLYNDPREAPLGLLIIVPIVFITQFLMVGSSSAINFCGAHKARAIWLPALIGGLAFTLLTGGFILGLSEFMRFRQNTFGMLILLALPLSWIFWTVIFSLRFKKHDPDTATGKILKWVLLGSVLEMIILAPMHVVTSARGGCLAGLNTALGLLIGLSIAFWSFGPGIILLFIRHLRKQRAKQNHG